MSSNSLKNFNVNIDESLAEEFSIHIDARGFTKYRAVEGALRAFMALPAEVQTRLIANQNTDIYSILVRGLVDSEIQKHLDKLGPAKEKFLALLTQAASPKPPGK